MFTGDASGIIKQWCLGDLKGRLYKDWGRVHQQPIYAMKVTTNSQFLLTAGGDQNGGYLKQWSLIDGNLFKDYGKISDTPILTLCLTSDGQKLFVAGGAPGFDGFLKELCLDKEFWENEFNL